MENLARQMSFIRRNRIKDQETLARKIYELSIKKSWPGLGNDIKYICLKIGIPDLNHHDNAKVNIKKVILSNYYSWFKLMLLQVENLLISPLRMTFHNYRIICI